jgi:hypothetical protein
LTNNILSLLRVDDQCQVLSTSNYNGYASGSVVDGGTLASWQSANSSDANSRQGTITYAGGDDSQISYYALVTGSVGKSGASDGTDMGADITRVGAQAA